LLERTLSRPWSPARLESSDAESPSPAQDEGGRKLEVELSGRRWTGPTSDAREDPRQAGRRGPELREEPEWPPPRSSQPQEAAMDQCPSRPEQTPRSGEHCHRDTGDGDAGLRDEQEECAERIPDLASELAEVVGEGRSTRRRGRAGGRGHGRESASQLTFFQPFVETSVLCRLLINAVINLDGVMLAWPGSSHWSRPLAREILLLPPGLFYLQYKCTTHDMLKLQNCSVYALQEKCHTPAART
jgi:hypothetical protein